MSAVELFYVGLLAAMSVAVALFTGYVVYKLYKGQS